MYAQFRVVHAIVTRKSNNAVRAMPILEGTSNIVVLVADSIELASWCSIGTTKNNAHQKVALCGIWPSMIAFQNSETIYNNFMEGGELVVCMAFNVRHSR